MKKAEEAKKKTRPRAEKPAVAPAARPKAAAPAAAETRRKTPAASKTRVEKPRVRGQGERRGQARHDAPSAAAPAAEPLKPQIEHEDEIFVPDEGLLEEEALPEAQDELLAPEDIELDPLEIPLELLDPVLADVPRPPAPARPKPKPSRSERRMQQCAGCGGMYTWLSVEHLCFSCLKRKLAQRKREDESYSGYPGEPEEESDS